MSALTNDSLAGFLAVYAQESLDQFIAEMPSFNLFTKDFSPYIAEGGTSFTTRLSTTNWGSAQDLTQGWSDTVVTASAVTGTLKIRARSDIFDELQWSTITPEMLKNTFLAAQVKQLANDIVIDAINNVTSSYFTNTVSPTSSSNFTITGSTSLQQAATTLSNLEIPEEGRYAIVTPNIYQSLTNGILPTYVYGNSEVVQHFNAPYIMGFDVHRYARLYNASLPAGGASYGNSDKLVGLVGNQQGLVAAVRQPLDVNNGLVQSATAVDKSSGLSLQLRFMYDMSKPVYRMAAVSIFGTAAGNKNAIVPIITQSV